MAVNNTPGNFFTKDSKSNTVQQTVNGKQVNIYKQGVIKNFYKISEFYNFIKTPQNNPITTRNHVLVPYPHNGNQYFNNRKNDLYRMVLSFQNISSLPDFGQIGDKDLQISNSVGRYTTMGNSTFGTTTNSFTAQFLQMNQPIHETFFYEWYLTCFNSGFKSTNPNQTMDYPFPRLDFAIKYFRPDQMIPSVFEEVQPTFIYWIMRSLPSSN